MKWTLERLLILYGMQRVLGTLIEIVREVAASTGDEYLANLYDDLRKAADNYDARAKEEAVTP